MSRMRWVWLILWIGLNLALAQTSCEIKTTQTADKRPITGFGAASLEPFDRIITRLLVRYGIPGAALAVSKHGRLLLSRGYGWANVTTRQPVQPNSRFRLASLSKPITAVATLHLGEQLVAEGRYPNLESFLNARVLPLLNLRPINGKLGDPRLNQVTIRDLLQHSGGWNRNWAGDPLYRPTITPIAKALGKPETLSSPDLLQTMLSRKLQFAPGSRSVYSNVGYLMLGRVVEQLSGQKYPGYVREMLSGMGIYNLEPGHTNTPLPNEVRYYDFPGAPMTKSMLDSSKVSRPYGEFYLEAQIPNAGWIASAPELVQFVAVLQGERLEPSPISPNTLEAMLLRPTLKQYKNTPHYYGLGWGVRLPNTELEALKKSLTENGSSSPTKAKPKLNPSEITTRMESLGVYGLEWSHDGALAGTRTLLLRLPDGTTIAALFNSRPWRDWAFIAELRKSLINADKTVQYWPEYDCSG